MPANTITIAQLPTILRLHAAADVKPALILGKPGSGKTEVIAQFAAENGFDLFTFMLNQHTPSDLKGYFVPDKEARRMVCFPSAEIPWSEDGRPYAETHGGRRPLLMFDELLSAMIPVEHVAQQLIHERRIGAHRLPPDVMVVAAANGAAMKCGSNKLTMSLADRFAIYSLEAEPKQTLSWMEANGVHHMITAFLRVQTASGGGVLWSTPMDKWSGEEPIDSSRSYTALSRLLKTDDGQALLSSPLLPSVCAAHIGASSGAKLAEFIRLAVEIGNIAEMIADPAGAVIPGNPSARWAIASCAVMHTTAENLGNVLALARRLTPPEMVTAPGEPTAFEAFVIRAVIQSRPSALVGSKEFSAWATQYGKMLKA